MAIDRDFWKRLGFSERNPPSWPCPNCHKGVLVLVPGTLHRGQTAESIKYCRHEGYDPDGWSGRFTALCKCSNPNCEDVVSVLGWSYEHMCYEESCTWPAHVATLFDPPLHPFQIHNKCPKEIAAEIVESFRLFSIDPPGAMNHLRKAVEILLDHLKVPRFTLTTKNGKKRRHQLSLHHRIEKLAATKAGAALASRLLAIKWIGNAGSHGEIVQDDVFDAFDLFDDLMHTVFAKREKTIADLAKQINKRKGPRNV